MNQRHRALLDYLILTTYQKRRQDGEIWTVGGPPSSERLENLYEARRTLVSAPFGLEGRPRCDIDTTVTPLPTDLPYRLGSFEAALTDNGRPPDEPLKRLALLLQYAAAPLRWEPFNVYHPHYGVASPRSLMLCDLNVVAHGSGLTAAYRYLPEHHALESIAAPPQASDSRPGLSLFIVGNLSRSARPYGDFSACLVSLEAGGLAAQLALMARAVGWSGPTRPRAIATNHREALGLTHWSEIVLGQIDFDGFDLTWELQSARVRTGHVSVSQLDQRVEAYTTLRDFVCDAGAGAFRLGAALPALDPPSPGPPSNGDMDDLLQVMARRSSGLDNDGSPVLAARFDRSALDALVADWCFILARCLTGDLAAVPLSIAIAVLNGQEGITGRYSLVRETCELRPIGPLDKDQIASFSSRQYWEGLSLVVSFSVDPWAVFRACPDSAFAALHGAAGACGHALALAAARRGAFARPLRAYTEFALGGVTPTSEIVVLQLVCGFSRRPNPTLDLI